MHKIKIVPLLISIGICLLAGGVGSFFTFPAIGTWYSSLNKPFFNPPNWVFGPVWTLLYILMGISLYLVWNAQTKKKEKKQANIYFFIQLGLNTLWSILFFGLRSPIYAFFEIIFLEVMIYMTIKYFLRISTLAGKLLLPYLAWVSFAAVLNLYIVYVNT